MSKYRVCTTISAKHWELLKKYKAKFETQQRTLEVALETLENDPKNGLKVSQKELFWQCILQHNAICHIHKDVIFEMIRTADLENIKKILATKKIAEYLLTMYYQKPLNKCSLIEVLDGIILVFKAGNVTDTMRYTDEIDWYVLKIVHSLNENCSKMFVVLIESVFKAYGLKTESEVSEKSLFIKVYKNLQTIQ